MRLVAYNIMGGGEGRADPIAEVLLAQHADVIAILEADREEVLSRLARRLAMDYVRAESDRGSVAMLSRWKICATINHNGLLEVVVVDHDGNHQRFFVVSDPTDFADELMKSESHFLCCQENSKMDSGVYLRCTTTRNQIDTPLREVSAIFAKGVHPGALKQSWTETDRLAKYASDHYPVGVEVD